MKGFSIICFILAGLSAFVATRNVIEKFQAGGGSSSDIGYAVGAFLLPVLFLAGGLIAHRRTRK